eukprot:353590-Chlamydomonas_euryale.AAC.12
MQLSLDSQAALLGFSSDFRRFAVRHRQVSGVAPSPRGGLACVAIGTKVVIFGGSDRAPMPFDDLWVLETGERLLMERTACAGSGHVCVDGFCSDSWRCIELKTEAFRALPAIKPMHPQLTIQRWNGPRSHRRIRLGESSMHVVGMHVGASSAQPHAAGHGPAANRRSHGLTSLNGLLMHARCRIMPRSGSTLSAVNGKLYLYGGQVRQQRDREKAKDLGLRFTWCGVRFLPELAADFSAPTCNLIDRDV